MRLLIVTSNLFRFLADRLDSQFGGVGLPYPKGTEATKPVSFSYEYKKVEGQVYILKPCPPRYECLARHSNVAWVSDLEDGLMIAVNNEDAIIDIVTTLDSTCPASSQPL